MDPRCGRYLQFGVCDRVETSLPGGAGDRICRADPFPGLLDLPQCGQGATEALAGNEGKIVYGYSLGTTDYKGAQSTDPSGIDAEASIRNGAHIVYSDTNNSSNDFHQRAKASLKQ